MPNFIDMFAGAGGFSEGFLQAELDDKHYDFLLASDINPTCEVTHIMRYNKQLGLNTQFLTKDITDSDFIETLQESIENAFGKVEIDVLTGGPPCQSFSLAGERRKNDKKDDLFEYYLRVIEAVKPKYFIMENVHGILTKDNGRVKTRIIKEINDILDYDALSRFVDKASEYEKNSFELAASIKTLRIWIKQKELEDQRRKDYVELRKAVKKLKVNQRQDIFLEQSLLASKNVIQNELLISYCKELSELFVGTYRNSSQSQSDEDERNVVRQALSLIANQNGLQQINKQVKNQINLAQLKRSVLKTDFDKITETLDTQEIFEIARKQCEKLGEKSGEDAKKAMEKIILALTVLEEGPSKTFLRALTVLENAEIHELDSFRNEVPLYHVCGPQILLSSDYGVPQNRVRVVFIGCRKDQDLIPNIPATVSGGEKVSVAEGIGDLAYVKVGAHPLKYDKKYANEFSKTVSGRIKRSVTGRPDEAGKTFSEWSREGRLNLQRFPKLKDSLPAYTSANAAEEINDKTFLFAELQNHETSNHNEEVQGRYALIRKYGDYKTAKEKEPDNPLLKTHKRNYTLLDGNKPATTIMTIGDDYCHYKMDRALTVREMARLQSFDDSFVFQGKRTTGGDRRKLETPQFTQVGNAVPPLMARAIATEILKHLK